MWEDRLGSNVKHYPYGEERTENGQSGYKFATYWRENSTRLDYADQRWYSSRLGRFLQADLVDVAELPEPSSWNKYVFVGGDPMNYADPTGEFRIPVISGIGGFLASFFKHIFGLANTVVPMPQPVRWSPAERAKVHKETNDKWVRDLATAVAAATAQQRESEKRRRYPKYLTPVLDRYYRFGNGPVYRDVTYELYDDVGDFMSGAIITEELVALEGLLPISGGETSGSPGGRYQDQLSTVLVGPRVLLQRFKVTTLPRIDDYIGVFDMPVYVHGFGEEWGVLYLSIRPDAIKIQGIGGPGCGK